MVVAAGSYFDRALLGSLDACCPVCRPSRPLNMTPPGADPCAPQGAARAHALLLQDQELGANVVCLLGSHSFKDAPVSGGKSHSEVPAPRAHSGQPRARTELTEGQHCLPVTAAGTRGAWSSSDPPTLLQRQAQPEILTKKNTIFQSNRDIDIKNSTK